MKKFILFLLFHTTFFGQAGSYDTTFSTDGIASVCQSYTFFSIDAAQQSTGKIINYGDNYAFNRSISLVRYNPNGTLDSTFGVGGFINSPSLTNFPTNRNIRPGGIAIQADDKIVIMGFQQSDAFGNGFWVARLLQNGAADTTFNSTGYLDLFFGSEQTFGKCIKIQLDGKIIVAGHSGNIGQNFAMARINPNGTLDTTFGSNGKVETTFTGTESGANSIAVQPDGKIVLGGWTSSSSGPYDFGMIRYNINGSVDTTFGINGKVITAIVNGNSETITKLLLQSDGKILVGGTTYFGGGYFCLARYLTNGSLDASFGSNGLVFGTEYAGWNCDIAQQIDGKIVLAGGFNSNKFSYLRYLNNGQIDTTFPVNGFFANVGLDGYASSVIIQSDNKLIICGSLSTVIDSFGNTILCSGVVRLNPGTLAIEEFANKEIVIYPNPTTGVLNFSTSIFENNNYKVIVFNVIGQKVFERENINTEINSLDLSSLIKGTYFITLGDKEKKITKTIIIK